MTSLPDSGYRAVVEKLVQERDALKPMLGHTFVGYRVRGFDGFVAVFKSLGSTGDGQTLDKFTCEQIVKNAAPGTEVHESAKQALKHWPPSE